MSLSFRRTIRKLAVAAIAAVVLLPSAVEVRSQDPATKESPFSVCWQLEVTDLSAISPVAFDGLVILPERGGRLVAIDESDGKKVWSIELGGELASNLAVAEDTVYVISAPTGAAGSNSTLRSIDIRSGVVRTSFELSTDADFTISATPFGVVVVTSSGKMRLLTADLQRVEWQADLKGAVSIRPAIGNSLAAVVTNDRRLNIIDLRTGKVGTRGNWERRITAVAVLDDGVTVLGDERGVVAEVSEVTGGFGWQYKTGGAISYIAATSSSAIATSNDNFVYRLDADDGGVLWRKRLSGRAAHRPVIAGEKVVIASVGESTVPIVSNESGSSINKIELGGDRYVTADPLVTKNGRYIFIRGGVVLAVSQSNCGPN